MREFEEFTQYRQRFKPFRKLSETQIDDIVAAFENKAKYLIENEIQKLKLNFQNAQKCNERNFDKKWMSKKFLTKIHVLRFFYRTLKDWKIWKKFLLTMKLMKKCKKEWETSLTKCRLHIQIYFQIIHLHVSALFYIEFVDFMENIIQELFRWYRFSVEIEYC